MANNDWLKYCPICGTKSELKYPGENPENGPATPHCPTDGMLMDIVTQLARDAGMDYPDDECPVCFAKFSECTCECGTCGLVNCQCAPCMACKSNGCDGHCVR